jgi:hypothetical protein
MFRNLPSHIDNFDSDNLRPLLPPEAQAIEDEDNDELKKEESKQMVVPVDDYLIDPDKLRSLNIFRHYFNNITILNRPRVLTAAASLATLAISATVAVLGVSTDDERLYIPSITVFASTLTLTIFCILFKYCKQGQVLYRQSYIENKGIIEEEAKSLSIVIDPQDTIGNIKEKFQKKEEELRIEIFSRDPVYQSKLGEGLSKMLDNLGLFRGNDPRKFILEYALHDQNLAHKLSVNLPKKK